jgi:signal peptidase II
MQTTPGTPLTGSEPDTDDTPHRRRPELRLWLAVVVAVYALDQITKWWAEHALADGEPREVVGDLIQFHLAHNAGAAFSTGTSYTVVLTLVALTVIAVCLRMAGRLRSRGWAVALGLVVGGALGNVTDRLFRDPSPFRGHVVDFIELPHWPIFNVADSAITIAAVLFVWLAYRGIRVDGTRA